MQFRALFSRLLILTVAVGIFVPVRADEGMWTFANPPLKQLKEKFGFEPDQAWLDHVRMSACRLNNGGSGSFVSASGLVLTNHHVARPLLAKLSTAERDLLKSGFYAPTPADELKCQDLEINVLVSFEDVTAKIHSAAQNAPDEKTAETKRRAETARIEKESTEATGLRSDVVKLYEGGEYWLYRYKKYTDVRLVFAPEAQAAEFGGDYDNFTFPRYALDFAFLRVYENDKPVNLKHYYRWSAKGAAENELIFVVGNPGRTDRLRTVAELEYQRDIGNPMQLRSLTRRREALMKYSSLGTEQARRASDEISSLENSLKRLRGQQEGLEDAKLMRRKTDEEADLRSKVRANSELEKQYGDAWTKMSEAAALLKPMAKRTFFTTFRSTPTLEQAVKIVQLVAEVRKPNSDRLTDYRDSNLESLKFELLSTAPLYADMEECELSNRLREFLDELGPNDPLVKAALDGKTSEAAAKEYVAGTRLFDSEFRKSLIEGGLEAVEKSTDPMIRTALRMDPVLREVTKWNRENFESLRAAASEKVAKALFAVYGRGLPPDANFTIRLSYGVVKGYEVGTTLAPHKTTFGGLYARGADFDQKPPFNVAPRIAARQVRVDPTTPMDFVYTADTIGGNSGSPVINRNGEIVGVNFDSNAHRFVSRYVYTEERGRAMAVHSAAILETLRKIYDADALADELEGRGK